MIEIMIDLYLMKQVFYTDLQKTPVLVVNVVVC